MAIKKTIIWKTLSVTNATLRISGVVLENNPVNKVAVISYDVYASPTSHSNGDGALYSDTLRIDSDYDPDAFAAFKSKMEEAGENIFSAAYVAIKQLVDWTGAAAQDLGNE